MKLDDFGLSISFPEKRNRCVEVSINWKHRDLISVYVSLDQFSLALSSLQRRPIIEVDFNIEIIEKFLNEIKKLEVVEISISDTSTQKTTIASIVGFNEFGTTSFVFNKSIDTDDRKSYKDLPFTSEDLAELKKKYPKAKISLSGRYKELAG